MWARGGVRLETCPKSYITPNSVRLLEEFAVRKRLGVGDAAQMEARTAEAFLILEDLWQAQRTD